MAKNKPQIVDVPRANYIAVRGKGDPNEENGACQIFAALSALSACAITGINDNSIAITTTKLKIFFFIM